MSSVPDGNRFAPPTAHVADMVAADDVELGGRGARLGAAVIDVAIAIAAAWLVGRLTSLPLPALTLAAIASQIVVNLAIGFALFVAIHGYLLATRGQTIGKMLVGLRIVRSDGESASFGRLVGLRYAIGSVIGVIPVIGVLYVLVDCLLIFRESRQCLHDNIADTIVVKA